MFTVSINGKDYASEQDKTLLRFLREDLHLTAAKDGCSEGVCGACTVLIDGKKVKACTLPLSRLAGKKVLTVEGIPPEEMRVYEHCFAASGAVQCGFCTPGMIISAKSLLDVNPNPGPEDVKKSIRGNLCRCTGYKKIEEAILMAAAFFRENKKIPEEPHALKLDRRAARIDAARKINGTGIYADDLFFDGMLYARMIFSRYPRARIDRLDVSKAQAHPACFRVLTKKDVPCNVIGHLKQDWDVMMGEGDITKYVGNVLAVVASEDPAALEEIASLVEVEYTPLTPVTTPEDALKFDAPLIHPDGNVMSRSSLRRGDADAAIRASRYVVTRRYRTGWQEHGFLEPECAVALPEGEDGILIYTSGQSVYDVRRECARMLNLPAEKVHARATLVGGGFGGKEDMSVQPCAALMAYLTKRPVKLKYSRQESLDYHVKRHPMTMEFTTACDENGRLTAMKGVIIADTGAYASLGGPVLDRACTHAAGPYNYQNLDIFGMSVYTNNVVSGAFRGFGVTQSCFATEQNMNLLAEMAGLDPWEFRRRNVIRPGDRLPNGQLADPNCKMAECLDAVKEAWYGSRYAGLAIGFKNAGTGMGLPDTGRCLLSVEGGRIHIRTSASCMGQGIGQMCLTQICDVTGLDPRLFLFETADTVRTPDAGTSTASRQTAVTGEAARRAARLLKAALDAGETLAGLEGREFLGEFSPETDPLGTVSENPVSHVAYSYAAQVVILDEEGRIRKAVSAFDIGTPVNIQAAEGQIEGGLVMGIGYGVTEKYICEDGFPRSRFAEIGFLRADEVPEMETVLIRPSEEEKFPFSGGAKGCGELCMIPTAPACAAAYYRFDGEFRQSLPLAHTPYRED